MSSKSCIRKDRKINHHIQQFPQLTPDYIVAYGNEMIFVFLPSFAALSDRGTVVLEAAMTNALFALERASSEKSRAEAACRGCAPCLFQDCGQSASCCKFENTLSF